MVVYLISFRGCSPWMEQVNDNPASRGGAAIGADVGSGFSGGGSSPGFSFGASLNIFRNRLSALGESGTGGSPSSGDGSDSFAVSSASLSLALCIASSFGSGTISAAFIHFSPILGLVDSQQVING